MNPSIWRLALASAENFVLICSGLSVVAFAVALFIRVAPLKNGLRPLSLSRLYATAIVIPPLASAWIVTASLLPNAWLGSDKWIEEHGGAHSFHLLNSFTFKLDPYLGYAALAFVFATVAILISGVARAYARLDKVVGYLQVDAEPAMPERVEQVERLCECRGIDVGLVVSRYPFSFVWGYLRSKLIISTGLLNALTTEELSALLEHEAAHHARKDNLLKWCLSGCRYASLAFPLTGVLYRWWSEQIEMVCDEVAARQTKAPIDVAGALVRLRRLTLVAPDRNIVSVESGFFGDSTEVLERRVRRLLSLTDEHERRGALVVRSWLRCATALSAFFAFTLLGVFATSPLSIHRLIEALLHPF